MSVSGPNQAEVKNLLLRSLPPGDYARLQPSLTHQVLPTGTELIAPDRPIRFCYFFESGLGSVLALSPNGQSVEMGLYGLDGFGGMPVVLQTLQSPHRLVMQIGGDGFRIPSATLQEALKASDALASLLLGYVQFFLIQTAQTCLSNALHPVEQRLARWLLMSHDRMPDDQVPLTHEYLSLMLGATRTTVTAALGQFSERRLVETFRGQVRILDRRGLERTAGEAYGLPEQEFERLTGIGIRKPST